MEEIKVLVKGYTSADAKLEEGDKERTCTTISLIIDEDIKMVVDPGVLKDKNILINALKNEGLKPEDINYVALTHSHIDHFRNIGLFPNAKLLEFFGIWHEDTVDDWKENYTSEYPYADNMKELIESRKKILKLADWIIPGHGEMFKVKK